MNKCPNCNGTNINKLTSDSHKMALVEDQIGTEKEGVHFSSCMPTDVYICEDCHFIGLFGIRNDNYQATHLGNDENKDS